FRALALTSGTTSGTSGSMRQALLLSMTMAPALAAMGLYSRLTMAGVLDRTMSTPTNASGRIGSTGYVLPLNVMDLPALRSEARNLIARKGNECSSSTCRMISPTAPVAPTTATLGNTPGALSQKRARVVRRPQYQRQESVWQVQGSLRSGSGTTARGRAWYPTTVPFAAREAA